MSNLIKNLGIIGLILFIIGIIIVEIVAIVLIAGAIASYFGFTGILWWVVAGGLFIIINSILGALL